MDLAGRLAGAVVALGRDRVLVGIDGPDAAGKTSLADRLAEALPGVVLDPERAAHVLVDNDDVTAPRIVRRSAPAAS